MYSISIHLLWQGLPQTPCIFAQKSFNSAYCEQASFVWSSPGPWIKETSELLLSTHLLWGNWDFTHSNICTSFNTKGLHHSLHRTSSIASVSFSPLCMTFLVIPHPFWDGDQRYICTNELCHNTVRFFSLFFSTQFLNVTTTTRKLINIDIFFNM